MDDFNIMEIFDTVALEDVARWAGASLPVKATVAVGVCEYDSMGFLDEPITIKTVNNALPINHEVAKELDGVIEGAAEQYSVQDRQYDVKRFPVLSLSIEDEDDCFGVIFIAIHIEDSHFVYTRSQNDTLLGEIQDRIDSITRGTNRYVDEGHPEIWHTFGILIDKNIVYDEQISM